jgi:hypothetical protein
MVNQRLMTPAVATIAEVDPTKLHPWYCYGRVRYRSLVNNPLQLQLLTVGLNLRRALVLTG